MSMTNGQVFEAFTNGQPASNARRSLWSSLSLDRGATFLYSYNTVIAIRRNDTGEVFNDGHRYSNTTTAHQGSWFGPRFSFDCVRELMGPEWYMHAHIESWGPKFCNNVHCQRENRDRQSLYESGLIEWEDDLYHKCWANGADDASHEIVIPDYEGWPGTAVLLSFDTGQHVVCGYERGKRRAWANTDQLWAALLREPAPSRIDRALAALNPAANLDRPVKRQGDLYFVPCENGDGPPDHAINLDGALLPPGERANHRASKARAAIMPAISAGSGEWVIWARGNIDHPEHPRLRLGQWHRVLRSQAARAVSSAYAHPLGRLGGAYGD